jgi:hypothetical protein
MPYFLSYYHLIFLWTRNPSDCVVYRYTRVDIFEQKTAAIINGSINDEESPHDGARCTSG